jgi:hypothetical protein
VPPHSCSLSANCSVRRSTTDCRDAVFRVALSVHVGSSSRLRKNSVGTSEFHWCVRLGLRGHIAQDAQKGQTSHPPNPGAPRRAVPRARPQRAKRRRGTDHTSCGPFALAMDLGERKSPSSASDLRESHWYVELLSEARTKLADFFSILLEIFITSRRTGSPFSRP